MGYWDSRVEVKYYTGLVQADTRNIKSVDVGITTAQQEKQYYQSFFQNEFENNKTSLTNYYDGKLAVLNQELSLATDQTEINRLKSEISKIEREKQLALSQLNAEYDSTNNSILDPLFKKETMLKLRKEDYENNKSMHQGLLTAAKNAVKEALQDLFPQKS